MVRALIIAALCGIIVGDLLLDVMFPLPAAAVESCCDGWKPCPGRKPVRVNGHTYTWYCGPDAPVPVGGRAVFMDERAADRRAQARPDRSGAAAARVGK